MSRDDVPVVFTHASDPRVTEYLQWSPHENIETTKDIVQSWIELAGAQNRSDYELAIEKDRTLVGTARLTVNQDQPHRAEIGYVVNPNWWGRGIATEATRLLIDFGFAELRLHRIWASVDPVNGSSCRVLEKAGMKQEGCLQDDVIVAGEFRSSLIYAAVRQAS